MPKCKVKSMDNIRELESPNEELKNVVNESRDEKISTGTKDLNTTI